MQKNALKQLLLIFHMNVALELFTSTKDTFWLFYGVGFYIEVYNKSKRVFPRLQFEDSELEFDLDLGLSISIAH
ncbi:hypothetical protein NC652_009992 [Populus alba x Populus x berolinensis]|nr:hypothetical protein NC652_009992 [Populus alba x Populus x berolinensis]